MFKALKPQKNNNGFRILLFLQKKKSLFLDVTHVSVSHFSGEVVFYRKTFCSTIAAPCFQVSCVAGTVCTFVFCSTIATPCCKVSCVAGTVCTFIFCSAIATPYCQVSCVVLTVFTFILCSTITTPHTV